MTDQGIAQIKGLSYFDKCSEIFKESMPNGTLDYVTKGILPDRLTIIGSYAYNNKDAGNLLWGYSMQKLSMDFDVIKLCSELNAFYNGKLQNSLWDRSMPWIKKITGTGDSRADQTSIRMGYYYPSFPPQK
jgi:hypothetical protein